MPFLARENELSLAWPRVNLWAMITAKQVRDLITAIPFKPFRIHMSDGSHYDISNRDVALVERTTIDVGLNLDADGIAERVVRCSILHIVKLEDIEADGAVKAA